MTFQLNVRVKHGAKLLNELDLLTKIGDGDMVAMEKKYHNHCLCVFYKKVNNVTKNKIQVENDNDSVFYEIFLPFFCFGKVVERMMTCVYLKQQRL